MVLEWTPEEASLHHDIPFSAAASMYSEPPDIFQHQSTARILEAIKFKEKPS